MRLLRKIAIAAASVSVLGCATVPAAPPQPVRAAVPVEPFVIAANPLGANAGLEVLKRGGSAIDAAVAMEAMLSLVEPQSSGLGGGTFITYYDAASGRVSVYDGRETAPAQATTTMFLKPDGTPLPSREAQLTGRATGVPGAVAALALAHSEHGTLPWSTLFGDAQRTASEGIAVSPRLARFINSSTYPQASTPDARAYFSNPDGSRLQAGDTLRNPAYAEFLGRLATQGPAALYTGSTAARIVARTRAAPLPGSMTMADLASYRPIKREALCRPWRIYIMCVPPPPSSGVGLIQLMKLLETTDIAARGPDDPQAWLLFAEASRIMYTDRDRYVADPAFVTVPVEGLLDLAYIAQRARLIGATAGPPPAGVPAGAPLAAADRTLEPVGTTHFIVRDAQGNVVSMTATVESVFGSGRMVDGFFLNNQMTDFSFRPTDDEGRRVANAVAPGKRPRSSMVPTILVTPDGRFAGAIGSAGGNAILAYVAKSLVAAVDWNLPMQQAIAAPNLVARGSNFNGEVDKFPTNVIVGLRERGIDVKPGAGEDSGVQGVLIRGARVDGGADPRREGVVLVLPAP